MNKYHIWINTALVALLGLLVLVGGNQSGLSLGGSTSDSWTVGGNLSVAGTSTFTGASSFTGAISTTATTTVGAFVPSSITYPVTVASATTTLTSAYFGETIYASSTTGVVFTLPPVTAGAKISFVISAVFATSNMVIASAEGDNIEGALIVAGAVVDCDDEDQLNFVADGENLGDFVTLSSDGTNWFILESGALTSAKLTCTDPA